MIVLPAIDLLGGKCVRLLRGSYADATVYADDPLETARRLAAAGARALHVVDLDGAREGRPVHVELVAEIVRAAGIPVQCGGGLRTLEDAAGLLAAGVRRVLLGTAALQDPAWSTEAVRRFGPDRVVIAVDVRGGTVFVAGWTAGHRPLERVLADVGGSGVRTLLVTDIERDGTLEGPNLALYRRLVAGPFRIVAAGGVATAAHVRSLAAIGLEGAVVGRALYEGTLALEELRELSAAVSAPKGAPEPCS